MILLTFFLVAIQKIQLLFCHLQTLAKVPYKEWIEIERLDDSGDSVRPFIVNYFARKKNYSKNLMCDDIGVSVDLSILQDILLDSKVLNTSKLPFGPAFSFSIKKAHDCLLPILVSTPDICI